MSSGDYIQDHNERVLSDDGRFDPPDCEDSFDLVKDYVVEETDQRQYEANKALKAALKTFSESVFSFAREIACSIDEAIGAAQECIDDFWQEVSDEYKEREETE